MHSDTLEKTKTAQGPVHGVGAHDSTATGAEPEPERSTPHVLRMLRVGLCSVCVALLFAGWNPHISTPLGALGPPTAQARSADFTGDLRQRQVEFLHRIRQADPRYQTIDRAMLNDENELGVVLNRHVDMDDVRPLMRTLLTQMARAFPQQDLTVIAYAPTEPPIKIGTARLNARTRQMTYTPARPQ